MNVALRRRALLSLPLAALLLATAARAEREAFKFDGAHTNVGFRIRHFVSKVNGSFRKFDGTIEIDRAKPATSTVELKIDAASIDTGNAKRDDHLRSADFFDAAKFPEITFKSTKITDKGNGAFEVAGDLTMKGVTKPAVLTVTSLGFAKDARGNEKTGFDVTGKLNRKDFGVTWNAPMDGGLMLGEDVELDISVEANKKKPEAPAAAPK
jgi:polyisoprenoid-binding protein YceI